MSGRLNSILDRMEQIEGWFQREEGEHLYSAAFLGLEQAPVLVEIGSWHGRATVVLGSAAQEMGVGCRVYAVDPHEGQLGPNQWGGSSLEAFTRNIKQAGLTENVVLVNPTA